MQKDLTNHIDEIFIAGGLGDCLLYTPLIKYLAKKNNKKVKVYVHRIQHKDILKNNPFCNVILLNYEDLKKRTEDKPQPYYYLVHLPSISHKIKASNIIAKTFNVDITNDEIQIFLTQDELSSGRGLISKFKTPITINPSSVCSKNQEWYIERWNEVIHRLKYYTFIQIGLMSERLLEGVLDFRGAYTLREQLSVLANSKLHIGLDSFWSHAAAALNTKAIVLFGDSSPFVWGHDNNVNIFKSLPCSPCLDWIGGTNCPFSRSCMNLISVEEVVDNINQVINIKSI